MSINAKDNVSALNSQVRSKATPLYVNYQHSLPGAKVELAGNLLGLFRSQVLE
jgi:hypothetical protein